MRMGANQWPGMLPPTSARTGKETTDEKLARLRREVEDQRKRDEIERLKQELRRYININPETVPELIKVLRELLAK